MPCPLPHKGLSVLALLACWAAGRGRPLPRGSRQRWGRGGTLEAGDKHVHGGGHLDLVEERAARGHLGCGPQQALCMLQQAVVTPGPQAAQCQDGQDMIPPVGTGASSGWAHGGGERGGKRAPRERQTS